MTSQRRRGGSTPYAMFALACTGFVSLGLPDGLLGVAWPSMSASFGVDLAALGHLFVATTFGYFGASLAAAHLLRAMGVGLLLVLSCAATALSLIGYAAVPSWPALLVCGVLAGAGGGAIDAGLNTHAAHHFSLRAVNLLHACYGIGTAVGPLLMTAILVNGAPWRAGYVIVAFAQLVLALAFFRVRHRWSMPVTAEATLPVAMRQTLRVRGVLWSLLVFFLYVGAEASAGAWIFSLLNMGRDFSVSVAGVLASAYWIGLFAGRLASAFAPSTVRADALLGVCAVSALTGVALLAIAQSIAVAAIAVVLLGAGSGPIFPTLIASTPARHGAAHTANAVSMQVAVSALGLALTPAVLGSVGATFGLNSIPIALLGVWLTIAFAIRQAVNATTSTQVAMAR